jgi:hypothetical protein
VWQGTIDLADQAHVCQGSRTLAEVRQSLAGQSPGQELSGEVD